MHDGHVVVEYPIHGYTLNVPPKLVKDMIRVVCLYYAETHKWYDCPPQIPPHDVEGMKVA